MKINDFYINKKMKKTICTAIVAGTIALSGCAKADVDSPIYFKNVDDAVTKNYYEITIDDKEYFIEKSDLANAISEYNSLSIVGLRVDDNGNAIAVPADEINESDDIINCIKKKDNNIEDGSNYGIYIGGVDDARVVKGYNIKNDGIDYDISKEELINILNDEGFSIVGEEGKLGLGKDIEFEASPNGGNDTIKIR